MKKLLLLSILSVLYLNVLAQERVKRGAIYDQGQSIYAPMVGFRGAVPEGWFGTLPQDEEVFLLIPNGNTDGYMMINAHQTKINDLQNDWKHDFPVTDKIIVSIKGDPKISGSKLAADFNVTGARAPFVGYAEAIEGGYGWTVSFILLAPTARYEEFRKNFDQLVASASFEEPSIDTPYGDFDWAKFLKDKYLMSYLSSAQYKEQNEVWLCADGSFRSKIKAKGMLKVDNPKYKGNKKGTWTAEGVGEKGKLLLNFSKQDDEDVVLDMEINDDKIFVNGGRFFALKNDDCK